MSDLTLRKIDVPDLNNTYYVPQLDGTLATAFSTSATYAVGDLVVYNRTLYKCTTAVTSAGAWNASNWTAVAMSSEISNLKNDLVASLITDTASGAIASFTDGSANAMESVAVSIEPVQSGSGDPSPTNIRPISGWTQVQTDVTGVNVWDEEWELGGFGDDGTPNTATNRIRSKNFIPCKPSTTYYFKIPNVVSIFFYDEEESFISSTAINPNVTFTTLSNAKYIKVSPVSAYGTTYNNDISINYPATDTSYHAYTGTTHTTALGQTVYGGTLDVVSGVLTVTKKFVTFDGSESWLASGSSYYTEVSETVADSDSDAICNLFPFDTWSHITTGTTDNRFTCCKYSSWNYGRIGVYASNYTSISDWTAFLAETPMTVCYTLATPTTVQLTAQEVDSLLGDNNVFADAGNVTVTYKADTKLYIEKLTAPTEDDMIADHAISANSFFMIGNTLYRATTAIASGAAITVGTNATKLSLSDALNALA